MTGQFSESHLLPPATREDFEEYLSGVLGIPTPITTPSGLPVPDDFTDAAGQPWHVEAPGTLVRGRRPVTLDTTPGEVQARYDALVTPQEPQVAVSRQFLDRETGEPKDAADAQQGDLVITEWAPPPVQVDVLKARAGRTGQGKVYETPLRGADGVLRPDQRDTAGVTQPTDRRDPEPWRTDHRLVVGSTWRRQGCSRCDAIQREVESGDRHAQDHRAEHLREHEQKGT